MSLFDRYQGIRQYHHPIDSLLRVWPNGKDGARPNTANAVSKPEVSRIKRNYGNDERSLLEDVMATHQHQAPADQTHGEVIRLSTRLSKRSSTRRFRNEQWERRIEQDWQGHLETLRHCLSELLIGNQLLRLPVQANSSSCSRLQDQPAGTEGYRE